jgi:diguanylate cyclase (GGDEF)-like protein
MDDAHEFLHHVEIFSLLSQDEINCVLPLLKVIRLDAGETIFREGEEGSTLYIVLSGRISIAIRLVDGREREIAEFCSGDFFGEMSICENAPRSATCSTKEKSLLYCLHKRDFMKLIEEHPYIAIKIMYRMLNSTSQRLRDTGEFLSDMVVWGEKARKRVITDEMTGVYNRRFIDDTLVNYFASSKERGMPFSLIMVDLDYFRQINESYSMKVGDQVITAVVDVFKRHVKEKDIIARYGGDEFTIVLPDTDAEEAGKIAEIICAEVAELDILKPMKGPIRRITTSQGVAVFPQCGHTLKDLLETADRALYRAKEEGRNRVIIAG